MHSFIMELEKQGLFYKEIEGDADESLYRALAIVLKKDDHLQVKQEID